MSVRPSPPSVSVLTPTYNRTALLGRLFESLQAQTDREGLEWVVVDDGSTDGTRSAVEGFRERAGFGIVYHYQENAGKHAAHNAGIGLASGELVVVVDSDDCLVPDAIEKIKGYWRRNGLVEGVGGMAFLKLTHDGRVIGDAFPEQEWISDAIAMRYQHRVRGDKAEVWATEILRRYPFPLHIGRFVTEGLVWNRISRGHRVVYVNEPLVVCEYQEGGLSDRALELRVDNSIPALLYYSELLQAGRPLAAVAHAREAANAVRFATHAAVNALRGRPLLGLVAVPVGLALSVVDRVRVARRRR